MTPIHVLLGSLALIGAVILLARPWLVRRGWLYPSGKRGDASGAVMRVASLFEPEIQHVLEAEEVGTIVETEQGEPGPDPVDG